MTTRDDATCCARGRHRGACRMTGYERLQRIANRRPTYIMRRRVARIFHVPERLLKARR